jgi:transposase, IS6 family
MLKLMRSICRVRPVLPPPSAFTGFRFPREVIVLAVRWYLCYGLSYRDVEELLVERGITVDHVTVYRWVQRFTPLLIDAAQPCRHCPGDRWYVDETYVKVAGQWVYLYRAIDQFGQVIDVLVSQKRDLTTTRRFFTRALEHGLRPTEVTTDQAAAYARVLDELLPAARHVIEQYATDEIVNRRKPSGVNDFAGLFSNSGPLARRQRFKCRSGAGVKVERPAGRMTSARTGVASGGGGRGSTPSRRAG